MMDATSLQDVETWAARVGVPYRTFVGPVLWGLLESLPHNDDDDFPRLARVLIPLRFVARFQRDATVLRYGAFLDSCGQPDLAIPIRATFESGDGSGDFFIIEIDESRLADEELPLVKRG